MTGEDPDDALSKTKRDLLRIIDAADEGTITELTVQKVAFQLVRDRDVDSLKPFSIYIGGGDSIKIKKGLCQMEDDGLIETGPSLSDKTDADSYFITDKGEELLDKIGRKEDFIKTYQSFKARYGRTGNWWAHTDTIRSWISNQSKLAATDTDLYEALERRAQYGNADPLVEGCIEDPHPTAVHNYDGRDADIIHLALQLIKDKKKIPDKRDKNEESYEQYLDNRVRFSVRNIQNQASNAGDLEGKIAFIKGLGKSIEQDGQKFELKEDDLSSSPSIPVEFYGDWKEDPNKVIDQYSIGVIGYISQCEDAPVIRALGIIKSNPLPQDLRNNKEEDLEEILKQQRRKVGNLARQGEIFAEKSGINTETQESEQLINIVQNLFDEHLPTEGSVKPVQEILRKIKTQFRENTDDLMRMAFWMEVLRRIVRYLT